MKPINIALLGAIASLGFAAPKFDVDEPRRYQDGYPTGRRWRIGSTKDQTPVNVKAKKKKLRKISEASKKKNRGR